MILELNNCYNNQLDTYFALVPLLFRNLSICHDDMTLSIIAHSINIFWDSIIYIFIIIYPFEEMELSPLASERLT